MVNKKMTRSEDWTVWGDDREPVLVGTEDECKQYVVDHPKQEDLYVTDPEGYDWDYNDNDNWVKDVDESWAD